MPPNEPPKVTSRIKAMFEQLPAWTLAVDPGESVGITVRYEERPVRSGQSYYEYFGAVTLPYDSAHDFFIKWLRDFSRRKNAKPGEVPLLIIEEYRVYPDKAKAHIGKTIPTAECIGGFKLIARKSGCRVVEQPAGIKDTMAAILKGRGVKTIGGSRHSMDAELHMWYYALHGQEQERAANG